MTLPQHIDVSNAGPTREELLSVIGHGAAALIADMTATVSCDHAGADAIVRTYQRALVSGTQLRLVVTAPIVRRVLTLKGLDRLISIYPSLEAATAAGAPATAVIPWRRPGQRPKARHPPAEPHGHGAASSRHPAPGNGLEQPSPRPHWGIWSTSFPMGSR